MHTNDNKEHNVKLFENNEHKENNKQTKENN
jgi:hypothetical protein